MFEDLGIQMCLHSTLASYLEKLLWLLTGNFAKPGAQYMPRPSWPSPVATSARAAAGGGAASPVAGARIIAGLVPCNVIAEEILTDHPDRYRAMLVESGNPAHSLADSRRMREALAALDLVVVIDVAMTETARLADYVLPAPSQFEKWEATFFNFEFPAQRLPPAPAAPRPRPTACCPSPRSTPGWSRPSGASPTTTSRRCGRPRPRGGRRSPRPSSRPRPPTRARRAGPVVLYRTLGPTLPDGAASAAILWGAAHRCAMANPDSVRRAGFEGEGLELGEPLFDAVLASPSGVVFTVDEYDETWRRVAHRGRPHRPGDPRAAGRARRAWTSPRRPTPTTRSCSRPASAGRSRPTPSSATRPGARGTPTARCGCTRPTPARSASPTAAGPA